MPSMVLPPSEHPKARVLEGLGRCPSDPRGCPRDEGDAKIGFAQHDHLQRFDYDRYDCVLDYGIADIAQRMDGAATIGDYISNYLSGSHRDTPGRGCPFAALSCEMPRQSSAVRQRFTDGLREITKRLTSRMGRGLKPHQRYEEALATVTSLVGALVLARAVNDPKLSDDILRAARRRLKG
jgi:hypothetical protein